MHRTYIGVPVLIEIGLRGEATFHYIHTEVVTGLRVGQTPTVRTVHHFHKGTTTGLARLDLQDRIRKSVIRSNIHNFYIEYIFNSLSIVFESLGFSTRSLGRISTRSHDVLVRGNPPI